MISVTDALARVFAIVGPLGTETVPLREACGRMLAEGVAAQRAQPPFDASSMDGYAVAGAVEPGARFRVVGASAAGHGHRGALSPGEAVRIFTGAPVPEGARRVVIQEDVRREGDTIIVGPDPDPQLYIRAAGQDFAEGARFAPERPLRPADIALMAAMGVDRVLVHMRAEVALIATGDELVMPGEVPGPDQIMASNNLGLAALVESNGARARVLPIARDTEASLGATLDLAAGADLVVTIGGASVGEHDLVAEVAQARGLERSFYKVAMRPGKPLMAGRLGGTPMIGLPGNPVSSMVCGHIFLLPALRVLHGLRAAPAPERMVPLAAALGPNGSREHYMRARLDADGVTAEELQDSALLGVLAAANALIVRPPNDPARKRGEPVRVVDL